MADLKDLILNNIVKPALSGITPTVRARVKQGGSGRTYATIEIPVFDRESATLEYDDDGQVKGRNEIWQTYEKVPIAIPDKSLIGVGVLDNQAVWVEFLGNDRSEPRIIGKAGMWPDDPNKSPREYFDESNFQNTNSGGLIPKVSVGRGG